MLTQTQKRYNFDWGWGQCLAEMVAADRLHGEVDLTIWGIVTNRITWEFGKLETQDFTRHPAPLSIFDLDKLFAVVNYIFQQCETQLAAYLEKVA